MKILHTSDWHLGHELYGCDRAEEQQAMLGQMADIVRECRPDLFLLCGDVFHTAQPSAAVQRLFVEGLVRIHEANPGMAVVVTSGNHDSAVKHEIFRTPWLALGVHAIGTADEEAVDDLIVELPGCGFVAAVPYVNRLPQGFFQRLLDRVGERNVQGLPVVLSAHTTVAGCDFAGHDNATDRTVGGIDSLSLAELGDGYDYLALGHIHRKQFLHSGRHNVRYCGTPLPVSFDERFSHSVSLVTLGRRGDVPQVEELPIDNPRPLVTLPTEGFVCWEEALRLLADYPADIPSYVRLNVEVEDFLPPEARAEAENVIGGMGKQCRLCHINARRAAAAAAEAAGMTVQEFREEAPIEIARRYAYAKGCGSFFDEELQALFEEAVRQAEQDKTTR